MDEAGSIDLDSVGSVPDQMPSDDDGVGVHLTGDDGSNLDSDHMVVAGDVMAVDVPVPASMATSMATITSMGGGDDVGLLMAGVGGGADLTHGIELSHISTVSVPSQPMINTLDNTRTVQAVTLADGTTAFIQHPKGGKFLEGQTITLEDGSTAVVQGLSQVSNLPVSVSSDVENVVNDHSVISDGGHITDGQPVQLEDGTTALLHHTPKEGLQAIQLEDGTTAYITHPSAESLFGEAANLDSTTLSPDHLASQVLTDNLKTEALHTLSATTATGQVQGPVTVIAAGLPDTKTMFFGEKAYRCSFAGCGRLYTTTHHLKVHERSHTGVRPFKCDHEGCGKAFATGYGLKSHVRVHTGEKPYKCPEENCEKAFKTSGDLQKHVRTHTGERPFKCPFEGCDRSFTTSNIRKVHIRTHTGERPYICNEEGCGRAFASATNYKNHIRIHTGEKPYMCTVAGCGKRFTEYSSLYKHHVVHTHSKPYVCNHCGKTYRQTSTLAMHKRTAHGEDVTAESEAQLYQENQASVAVISGEDGDGEPEEKRSKLDFPIQNQTETPIVPENTMIINTTQAQEVVNNSNEIGEGQTAPTVLQGAPQASTVANVNISQLPPTGNIATITMGEDGQQQIFVITDPAQLEALQQLAAQQLQPIITTGTENVPLDNQSNPLTQTTVLNEQTLKIEQLEESVITNNAVQETEIGNTAIVEGEEAAVEEENGEVPTGEIITTGTNHDHIISFS